MSDTTDSQAIGALEPLSRKYFEKYYISQYRNTDFIRYKENSYAYKDYSIDEQWFVFDDVFTTGYQAAIATMQKELADVKEDLSTYMQITNDLTNENVEFCNKIESQTKELAECQLANMQMREDMSTIRHKTYMANGEDACSAIFKIADNALSLPSTTDALDSYVSEAVKAALYGLNSDK